MSSSATASSLSNSRENEEIEDSNMDHPSRLQQQQQQQHEYKLTPVQSTSLLVAYWRDLETRYHSNNNSNSNNSNNTPLIHDPTAQILVDALISPSQRHAYETSPIRPYGWDILAVRTRAMDDWLLCQNAATSRRRRQVVNLGAGMCGRPYRLKLAPTKQDPTTTTTTIKWWEVDSDLELLQLKQSVLKAAGWEPQVDLINVAMDLACPHTSFADCLQRHGFDITTTTTTTTTDWIAEGLFAYLTPDQHLKLLRDTAALSAPNSRMTLTVAEPALSDFWESLGVTLPYQNLVPVTQILKQAQSCGWAVDRHISPNDWSRLYPGRGEHLPGFNVVFLIKE